MRDITSTNWKNNITKCLIFKNHHNILTLTSSRLRHSFVLLSFTSHAWWLSLFVHVNQVSTLVNPFYSVSADVYVRETQHRINPLESCLLPYMMKTTFLEKKKVRYERERQRPALARLRTRIIQITPVHCPRKKRKAIPFFYVVLFLVTVTI